MKFASRNIARVTYSAIALIALSACGGGNTPPPPTGRRPASTGTRTSPRTPKRCGRRWDRAPQEEFPLFLVYESRGSELATKTFAAPGPACARTGATPVLKSRGVQFVTRALVIKEWNKEVHQGHTWFPISSGLGDK
jgi:hypothetical protein